MNRNVASLNAGVGEQRLQTAWSMPPCQSTMPSTSSVYSTITTAVRRCDSQSRQP